MEIYSFLSVKNGKTFEFLRHFVGQVQGSDLSRWSAENEASLENDAEDEKNEWCSVANGHRFFVCFQWNLMKMSSNV